MANTKISALPAVTSIAGTELIPLVQGGATKQATVTQILAIEMARAVAAEAALAASLLTELPEWQPNTVYTAGFLVLNQSGQIVQANTGFTSGGTYNAANWSILSLTVATVASMIAVQAAADAAAYSPLDRGTATQFATWKSNQAAGTEYVWNLTDGAGTLLDIVSGVV